MGLIVRKALWLRDKFGIGRRIQIQKMGVKKAFHQVGVDPAGAANVGYVLSTCGFKSDVEGAQGGWG